MLAGISAQLAKATATKGIRIRNDRSWIGIQSALKTLFN
jgi:hypothetical protein